MARCCERNPTTTTTPEKKQLNLKAYVSHCDYGFIAFLRRSKWNGYYDDRLLRPHPPMYVARFMCSLTYQIEKSSRTGTLCYRGFVQFRKPRSPYRASSILRITQQSPQFDVRVGSPLAASLFACTFAKRATMADLRENGYDTMGFVLYSFEGRLKNRVPDEHPSDERTAYLKTLGITQWDVLPRENVRTMIAVMKYRRGK